MEISLSSNNPLDLINIVGEVREGVSRFLNIIQVVAETKMVSEDPEYQDQVVPTRYKLPTPVQGSIPRPIK